MSNVARIADHERFEAREESVSQSKGAQLEDGYVRTANAIVEALCRAPLTSREARVVRAVERATFGWDRSAARLSQSVLAKMTGLTPKRCSETVNALLAKKVIRREGGSQAPIGINTRVSEWNFEAQKSRNVPKLDKNPNWGLRPQDGDEKRPQDGDTNTDNTDIPPLPSVEGEGAADEKPAAPAPDPNPEPKAKTSPGKASKPKAQKLDLSNLPAVVSHEAVLGFIEHRHALKKPLTQRALNLNVNEALRAAERIPGLTADQALDETVLAGWQGVKAEWLERRLAQQQRQGSGMNAAERLHEQNQQAIREAVSRRQVQAASDDSDLLTPEGGHW